MDQRVYYLFSIYTSRCSHIALIVRTRATDKLYVIVRCISQR